MDGRRHEHEEAWLAHAPQLGPLLRDLRSGDVTLTDAVVDILADIDAKKIMRAH